MSEGKKPPGPVGYGKPPVHSRFRKGQSGNPSGKRRPADAERSKKLIRQEAYRLLTVREGDKVVRMPALQAVLRSQIASAAKGSVAAQRVVVKTLQEIEAEDRASRTGGIEKRKSRKDVNEATDEELMAIANQGKTEV
jgi:Family of unknown function (DUF5681)